jgi:hypothetical protein
MQTPKIRQWIQWYRSEIGVAVVIIILSSSFAIATNIRDEGYKASTAELHRRIELLSAAVTSLQTEKAKAPSTEQCIMWLFTSNMKAAKKAVCGK